METCNAKLLDGERRSFPTDMLVGAEEILARLYHEHTKSKLYSRSTSGKSSHVGRSRPTSRNPLAQRRAPTPPAGSELIASSEKEWTPKSMADEVSDWTSHPDDPLDDKPLQWSKQGKWQRLRLEAERLADSRQFAPWHYKRDAMMHDDTGRLVTPPPKVKEQLHSCQWTTRLIGNGWH